jgi:tetratricopeptide (TPR) repeat protein
MGCVVAALGSGVACAAETAPATKPAAAAHALSARDQKELSEAVDALTSADAAERERASRRLLAAGRAAEPMLRAAAAQGELDPELAGRARELLRHFEFGISPETPPVVVALLEQYRRGPAEQRRAAAGELAAQGAAGLRVVVKLARSERDPATRDAVRRMLAGTSRLYAAALLAERDYDATEELLRACAVPAANEVELRDFAAFLAARGTLAAEIRRLTSAPAPPDPAGPPAEAEWPAPSPRLLALLHRAAGDLDSAVAAARGAEDSRLLGSLLIEKGDWAAAARHADQQAPGTEDLEAMAYAAAFHRLAGDDAGVARWCAAIAAAADPSKRPQAAAVQLAAEALLLNERPDAAVDLLASNGRFDDAFMYLRLRLKFDEMAALQARMEKEAAPGEAARGRAQAAMVAHFLGDAAGGRAALQALAAERGAADGADARGRGGRRGGVFNNNDDAGDAPNVLLSASLVRAAAGMADRALLDEHLVAGLERLEAVNAGGNEVQIDAAEAATLFAAAGEAPARLGGGFGDGAAAGRWWTFLRRRHREPIKITLGRFRATLDHTVPAAELESLARAAEQDAQAMRAGDEERAARLNDVADALLAGGRRDAAKRLCERVGFAGAAEFVVRLADLEAEDDRWAEAAALYERAWAMDRTRPIPPMLRGLALVKLGREREGRELIEVAHVLPLGDETRRRELYVAVERRKLTHDLRRERELVERAGQFLSWDRSDVLRRAGDDANLAKDFATAIRYWEQAFIDNFDAQVAFVDQGANVTMPALLLRTRALAAANAGDVAGAVALARRGLAVSPGDTDALIDVVAALDAANHRAQADALYAEAAGLYRRLCDAHPRSAALHNQFAWAAARCRRDLDDALAHAKAAVALTPDDAAAIDTLAEAQFQRGDVGGAIESIKRCVAMEPDVKHHREQLGGFEAALPGGGGGGK